jgi:hypothetical protein
MTKAEQGEAAETLRQVVERIDRGEVAAPGSYTGATGGGDADDRTGHRCARPRAAVD